MRNEVCYYEFCFSASDNGLGSWRRRSTDGRRFVNIVCNCMYHLCNGYEHV